MHRTTTAAAWLRGTRIRQQLRAQRWLATTARDRAPVVTAASDAAVGEKLRGATAAQSDAADVKSPWSHFQAFSGMDEYIDATLIQYKNDACACDNADASERSDAPAPLSAKKKSAE